MKLSEMKIVPTGSVKQELKLLCRIAEGVFSRGDVIIEPTSVANLATLLLGMIRTYTTSRKIRVEEEWVIDILRIYRSLLRRMEDATPHVPFISRLFGPATHSFSLFNVATVRNELFLVYQALSQHVSASSSSSKSSSSSRQKSTALRLSAYVMKGLVAMDESIIDSRDFGQCMPIFQALSEERHRMTGAVNQKTSSGSKSMTKSTSSSSTGKRPRSSSIDEDQSAITTASAAKAVKAASAVKASRTGKTTTPMSSSSSHAAVADHDDDDVWEASDVSWSALLGPHGCPTPRDASLCLAAAHECLRCMYDTELVIRTAALAALKRLCEDARHWCGLLPVAVPVLDENGMDDDEEDNEDVTGDNPPEMSLSAMHLLITSP